MSFEVEVKYRADGHADLESRLTAMGAVPGPVSLQRDAYLSHPARDFAQTHEALRLRRIGDANRVTYKGPRRDGPTKTRQEIELPLADGPDSFEDWRRLLDVLGFRPAAEVRKTRRPFHLCHQGREIEVALDSAEGLGDFAEVETIAESEDDLPEAQAAILDLASVLGLREVEPRSYLRMVLERRDAKPAGQTGVDLV